MIAQHAIQEHIPGAVDGRNGIAIFTSMAQQVHKIISGNDSSRNDFTERGHGSIIFLSLLNLLCGRLLVAGFWILLVGEHSPAEFTSDLCVVYCRNIMLTGGGGVERQRRHYFRPTGKMCLARKRWGDRKEAGSVIGPTINQQQVCCETSRQLSYVHGR